MPGWAIPASNAHNAKSFLKGLSTGTGATCLDPNERIEYAKPYPYSDNGGVASLEGNRPLMRETHRKRPERRKRISRKVVAVYLAAVLISVSGFYVWYEYFRHWSAGELEDAIILVDESGPIIHGFKTYLSGRTVTVDGIIKNTQAVQTSLGRLNFLHLEGARYVSLMQWGEVDYGVGERIVMEVEFRRGVINGIEGVFSPQATLGIGTLTSIQTVTQAVSWVSSGWAVDVDDDGDEVVVRIDRVTEPCPIGTSSCSIKAGSSLGMVEYVDVLGFYDDNPLFGRMPSLETAQTDDGTISFVDGNEDGYLDDGDAFVLGNLERPEEECSAQTYLFWVERAQFPEEPEFQTPGAFYVYLLMTRDGVLWRTSDDIPTAMSSITPFDEGVLMTVEYTSASVPWGDAKLLLGDGMDWVCWTANETMLSSAPGVVYSCGVKDVGDSSVECIVVDSQGDGHIGAGDRVKLLPRNGTSFDGDRGYTVSLVYEPTGGSMARESFVYGAVPISECSVTIEGGRFEAIFAPVHNGTGLDYMQMDVKWDHAVVAICDGTNTTEWQLRSSNLCSGELIAWTSLNSTLGDMVLRCTASDLQGNGLINSGDAFEIAVMSAEGFDAETDYTVAIRYIPTGTDLFSSAFGG